MNTNLPFVNVGSVTYAIKGRDILKSKGIKAYIDRTPKGQNRVGCGYSIYFDWDYSDAVRILTQSGVKIKQRGGAS
ncbi:MAG: DUF3343 domain-containing protein [Clostridia bacterium]|nr:DUF3343 domain-containing protein [Clostridia bacterium]